MRLAVVALVGLMACGVSRTGRADPPRTLVDPWAKERPTTIATDLIDPWKTEQQKSFVALDEVIDPWSAGSVPTARFPSLRPAKGPPKSAAVPTARFPVVDVIDPWKKP
jgi:hypothetical protein